MERSPKRREIDVVTGTPATIISRGEQVTELGEQMISAADLLQSIADGASGQRGLAVDTLQEKVGECHVDLRKAGDRYRPTGPVLVAYGEALEEVQPRIRGNVADCESLWRAYLASAEAETDARPGVRLPDLVPPTDAEQAVRDDEDEAYADAQAATAAAYEEWRAEAERFDANYDDWEEAFERAASDIRGATEGNISDGFWDDMDGFVGGVLEVLKWVGLAVTILGVIVGGPFLAALGAVLAIATLLLTVYAFSRGNASGWDLAWAIVGVIPFGSASKLFSGDKLGFLDDMVGGLGTVAGRSRITGELGGIVHGLTTGFSRGGGFLPGVLRGARGGWMAWTGPNGRSGVDVLTRLMTGKRMDDLVDSGRHPVDIVLGLWKHQAGWTKRIVGWAQGLAPEPQTA